jgi:hypothetical protein
VQHFGRMPPSTFGQYTFVIFAISLFAAAVALGIVAGQRWASGATLSAREGVEAGTSTPTPGPCPPDPRPPVTVVTCAEPFRVSWRDGSGGATGYRVELIYTNSGEQFRYTMPADVTTFVFPAEARPHATHFGTACLRRKDFTLRVFALGPVDERVVGGLHHTGECDLRVRSVPWPAEPPPAGPGR